MQLLIQGDPDLVRISAGAGSILVSPRLGGRVFCSLDGRLLHRLNPNSLTHPSPTGFDNPGGNFLWPAPEGGPFGFNYPRGAAWTVQDDIARKPVRVSSRTTDFLIVEKDATLVNRKGASVSFTFRRRVAPLASMAPSGLREIAYSTLDEFLPLAPCRANEVLLAPWSLEQFPLSERVTAFAKVAIPVQAVNADFYSDPGNRISLGPNFFTFRLGGPVRHQIGVTLGSRPELLGALDEPRRLLILRRTAPQQGLYFNIADNDQPRGPLGAADLYSVFNGAGLGFFELETVGAMRTKSDLLAPSRLESETRILTGDLPDLLRYLLQHEGLDLGEALHERR